jgi:DNA invertase Pin-like site-specific DNA recombinase
MPAERGLRCGIYVRVSTADQRCEGQLEALRRYADARAREGVGTRQVKELVLAK